MSVKVEQVDRDAAQSLMQDYATGKGEGALLETMIARALAQSRLAGRKDGIQEVADALREMPESGPYLKVFLDLIDPPKLGISGVEWSAKG